jgi:hypothetical protein
LAHLGLLHRDLDGQQRRRGHQLGLTRISGGVAKKRSLQAPGSAGSLAEEPGDSLAGRELGDDLALEAHLPARPSINGQYWIAEML